MRESPSRSSHARSTSVVGVMLLACASALQQPGSALLSRRPGEFTDFNGRRISFGSVQSVQVRLAGANTALLNEYLAPEVVATAMWDPKCAKRVDESRWELSLEKLSFAMLEIASSVVVNVERDAGGVITLTSESFSVSAQSPAGRLSTAELNIDVSVAGRLEILAGGGAVGGKVGFATAGDLPSLMLFTPRPVLSVAASGLNRAVMGLVIGEFERGIRRDFSAWQRRSK